MKKSMFTLLMAAALLCAYACNRAEPAGRQAADNLQAAWQSADTAALTRFIAAYPSLADSLPALTTRDALNDAFVDAATQLNDTLGLAAAIIAHGNQAADEHAESLVDQLRHARLTAEQATARISLASLVAARVGNPQWAGQFCQAIDSLAKSLPVEEQMPLYAGACTPENLGQAMRADRNAPNADTTLINKQIQLLKNIYTPEQMSRFNNAYNR